MVNVYETSTGLVHIEFDDMSYRNLKYSEAEELYKNLGDLLFEQ